jgi:hypothetical protein
MYVLLGQLWRAVRPVGAYQRLLWWLGTLLVASGAVHAVVAAVDGAWWGPVSWRSRWRSGCRSACCSGR